VIVHYVVKPNAEDDDKPATAEKPAGSAAVACRCESRSSAGSH